MEVKYPDNWQALKVPQWRLELMATLRALADPDYQREAWVEKVRDKDVAVGVQQACRSLFEDLNLDGDPEGAVGSFLFDEAELAVLQPVLARIGRLADELGEAEDAVWLAHPQWPEVVEYAAAAHEALAEQGLPTGGPAGMPKP